MNRLIFACFAVACLPSPFLSSTQATPVVSNLDQTPTGSAQVGSDSWIAQQFGIRTSDTNLYALDSVQLRLASASGAPSDFEVSLYSAPLNVAPRDYLGHLAGSTDPSSSGVYEYTASGIEISGGKRYFVVVNSATPVDQGAYVWSASDRLTESGSWVIHNQYHTSSDGSTWEVHFRREVFQMAIHARIVPEPSTLCLAGFGLGFLWFLRRGARPPELREVSARGGD